MTRLVSAFVATLLAGGPAVASTCELLCVADGRAGVQPVDSAQEGRHHRARDASHPGGPVEAGAAHEHQSQADGTVRASTDSRLRGTLPGRDCCAEAVTVRAATTALRTQDTRVPPPRGVVPSAPEQLIALVRRWTPPPHGPQPGDSLPVRATAILRI